MAISDAFLQELRGRVDMQDVASPYVQLRRRGRTLTGLCPFHNEKTPSFHIYVENQSFYCFGCGAGGDVITFVRRMENLDYVEAVKTLAQRAGMPMPEDGVDDTLMKRRQELLAANREAAHFYHTQLMQPCGKEALDYLLRRGITMKTIRHFGLGFAPNDWSALIKHMRGQNIAEQALLEANLARKSEKEGRSSVYDNFRNRIMFPIIDIRGNVIAFGGRVTDDSRPKYINTSDTLLYKKSLGVFALNFAKNANDGKLIVAEGYMDVIALHQAGFTNAIACLGTALTREQANLLSRYAKEVILAYDADGAGQQATKRAIEVFQTTSLQTRVLRLSGGKDPDEILREHGRERFQSLLDVAANDIEYRILREREKYDLETQDGKLQFLKAAAQLLAALPGEIERDIYTTRIAQELSVSKEALAREVQQTRGTLHKTREKEHNRQVQRALLMHTSPEAGQNGTPGTRPDPERLRNPLAVRAEEILLASLLRNPDFYAKLSPLPQAEDFILSVHKHLFSVLTRRLQEGKEVELSFLAQDFLPDEMNTVTKLFAAGGGIQNSLQECADCIAAILREKDKKQPIDVGKLDDEEYLRIFMRKS